MEDMNVMMNETVETTEDANVKKALGLIITGVAVVVVAGVGIAKAVKSGHTPTDSEESVEHSDDDGAEE